MGNKNPIETKNLHSEIEDEIARTKNEIDKKYYLLGKSVCEIAYKDSGKIGELVDKLVELKKKRKINLNRRIENEHKQSRNTKK